MAEHTAESVILTDEEVAVLLHEFVCPGGSHRRRGECERLAPKLRSLIEHFVGLTLDTETDQQVVYELRNGGRVSWHRVGVFSTIDKAKQAAAQVLETYREFDGDEDVERTDFQAEWTMQRETIGSSRHEVGEPKPFLNYGSQGSAFKIDTIEIDVVRERGYDVGDRRKSPGA